MICRLLPCHHHHHHHDDDSDKVMNNRGDVGNYEKITTITTDDDDDRRKVGRRSRNSSSISDCIDRKQPSFVPIEGVDDDSHPSLKNLNPNQAGSQQSKQRRITAASELHRGLKLEDVESSATMSAESCSRLRTDSFQIFCGSNGI